MEEDRLFWCHRIHSIHCSRMNREDKICPIDLLLHSPKPHINTIGIVSDGFPADGRRIIVIKHLHRQ